MGTRIVIPWGHGEYLQVDLWKGQPRVEVWEPDLSGSIGLGEYPQAVEKALAAPVSAPVLREVVGRDSEVAVVVDDPSRWTPVREALPLVLSRLEEAGVRPENISISAGVGRHRAVDRAAMGFRVGEEVLRTYRCYSPPVDDSSAYVNLGITEAGLPVWVFRPVAEADVRVLIGSVLPHLQAGFGGGYKLIFPGCSHRRTLRALHGVGLEKGRPESLLGSQPVENPMRAAIREAAALLRGPTFSLNHLMGAADQVLRVEYGDAEAIQSRLSLEAKARFQAPTRELADVLVAGNSPWPGDPMQSFKVLLNHRHGVKRGGVLVGFFWTDPSEMGRTLALRWQHLIAATGPFGNWVVRRGFQATERIATVLGNGSPGFMSTWARELILERRVFVYAPTLCDRLGSWLGPVRLFSKQDELWGAVRRSLGREPRLLRVFPRGGLSYCARAN